MHVYLYIHEEVYINTHILIRSDFITVLSPWLAADKNRVSHVLSHVV